MNTVKSPSKQAKAIGLKSLEQVSRVTGIATSTIKDWHRNKPELFKTVLYGVKARLCEQEGE